jgi:succinate-acetate transporter protein
VSAVAEPTPPAAPAAVEAPPALAVASGVPLAVFGFGFLVIALSMANAEWFNPSASLFVPVAFGVGALGMLVGGLMEFRNGNLFGATFGVAYACFLFTTPMILRWFGPEISLGRVAGVGGFGDSFGAYLLMWAVFTAFLTYGAYYVNLPAFLAFLLLVIV